MSVVKASSVCLSTMTKGASTHKHSEHAVPPPPVWRHPADGRCGGSGGGGGGGGGGGSGGGGGEGVGLRRPWRLLCRRRRRRSRPGGRGLAGAAWRRRRRRLKRSGGGGGRSTLQPPSPTPSPAAQTLCAAPYAHPPAAAPPIAGGSTVTAIPHPVSILSALILISHPSWVRTKPKPHSAPRLPRIFQSSGGACPIIVPLRLFGSSKIGLSPGSGCGLSHNPHW